VEILQANRQHLRTAKRRYDIGVAGKEEMLRWESEVASSQSDVMLAASRVQMAVISLNQLMNHPQETPFTEEEVGIETVRYFMASNHLDRFIQNRETLLIMLEYMTQEAFKNSPEIEVLELAISQQRLNKDTAMRKFWIPEANIRGHLDQWLSVEHYAPSPPENHHDDWFVGMELSYPIFEGGARAFNYDKQKAEWKRLQFKRDLQKQFVELDVRKAVYSMTYSYPNIELSKLAMENATKNYVIMQSKYSNGTASITALIDAQTDKFTQESRAVIAVYDFLSDVYTFDRAVSEFYSFASKSEQQESIENLKEYMRAQGVDI
jgi:outer membrane protein